MLLETIAAKILVSGNRFASETEAIFAIRSEFTLNRPMGNYNEWNQEVAEDLSRNIIENVKKNGSVSVRFIIKDLETISRYL